MPTNFFIATLLSIHTTIYQCKYLKHLHLYIVLTCYSTRNLAFDYNGKINHMNFTHFDWGHTDIERLRKGQVGGQVWSIYYDCDKTEENQVLRAMEAIDVVKRMAARYPKTFEYVTNTHDFKRAMRHGRIASAMGMEGGQMIDSSMVALRQFYELGIRYMTVSVWGIKEWFEF